MKDVIVYVEMRSVADNRTTGVKSVIANHGIKVNDRLLRYDSLLNFMLIAFLLAISVLYSLEMNFISIAVQQEYNAHCVQ